MNGNPFCDWNGDLHNESKAFVYEHQVLFNKDKTTLIAYRSKDTNYIIPNGVTHIGDEAFSGCESLTSINIPNSVTNIGNCAFYGCGFLKSINIPDRVTNIGDRAFSFCRSLTNINIPSSVVNMNGNPFCDWDGDLHNESKAFVYEHQVLFNKDKTTLIAYRSKEKNYIIPNSVTNIGNRAFRGCKSLTKINIPDGVTHIGDEAFSWCESLTKINIPDGMTHIGDEAFSWCENIPSKIQSDIINRFGKEVF